MSSRIISNSDYHVQKKAKTIKNILLSILELELLVKLSII